MERKRRTMTAQNLKAWTRRSQDQVRNILERADQLRNDPEKAKREEACLCRLCFYQHRLAGAAVTTEPCMCCGLPQTYGSTDTDALCLECAEKTGLCKHCGGDRELQGDRNAWPEPLVP